MKICNQCQKEFDTQGLICLDCIKKNWDRLETIDEVAQDSTEIYREDNVFLNNLGDSDLISVAEQKELDLNAYYICFNSVVRDSGGVLYTDWNERAVLHIRDIKAKLLSFRIQEGGARRAIRDSQIKATEKLTPEERERYIKDIQKNGKLKSDIKFEKREAKVETLVDKQIALLLKSGQKEDSLLIQNLRKLQK